MSDPFNVLFVSSGDSARSNMAESILTFMSGGRFRAYSAGMRRAGEVNEVAIKLLQQNKMPTNSLCIRKWDEFAQDGSPPLDFVITFSDKSEGRKNALWRGQGEICPIWPGQPIEAQWNIADPGSANDMDDDEGKLRAFKKAYIEINTRISLFTSLPFEKFDRQELQRKLNDLGSPEDLKEATIANLRKENDILGNKLDEAHREISRLNRIIFQVSNKTQQYPAEFH